MKTYTYNRWYSWHRLILEHLKNLLQMPRSAIYERCVNIDESGPNTRLDELSKPTKNLVIIFGLNFERCTSQIRSMSADHSTKAFGK